MQKTNQQKNGQDVKAGLKTVVVTEGDFVGIAAKLELTPDRIAAVISRVPEMFEVAYTKGYTVETKMNMRRVDNAAPTLISVVKVGEYIFFETANRVDVDRFAKILRPLTQLNGKNGKPVVDLYFVGFGHERYQQHVLTPDNRIVTLTRGDSGIASIRYDETNRRLIAIQRDGAGVEALVTLDIEALRRDPQALVQREKWQMIARFDKATPVFTLSRPKAAGRNVKFVVNFDQTARLLTLLDKNEAIWGEVFKTTEIQIGYLSGNDALLVGYQVTGQDTWINIVTPASDHPIAAYLA